MGSKWQLRGLRTDVFLEIALCGSYGTDLIGEHVYRVAPPKKKKKKLNSRYSRFSGLCSDQQLSLFTLLDRASFPHYSNTKIIKFGRDLFHVFIL